MQYRPKKGDEVLKKDGTVLGIVHKIDKHGRIVYHSDVYGARLTVTMRLGTWDEYFEFHGLRLRRNGEESCTTSKSATRPRRTRRKASRSTVGGNGSNASDVDTGSPGNSRSIQGTLWGEHAGAGE